MRKTHIQWSNYSHNFWTGCKKVSEGCKYCYMHRILESKGKDGSFVQRAPDYYFNAPYYDKIPRLIFTCSMSDFFIVEADTWREQAWKIIKATPWHTWQILTKRPERIAQCLPDDWGQGYPNVWLGVTVENQETISRVEELLKVPAKIYFISAEPLIKEVNFIQNGINHLNGIDWIIVGGESGWDSGKYIYRECKVEWMEMVVDAAKSNGHTKVFVKQMGTFLAKKGVGSIIGPDGEAYSHSGDNYDLFPDSLKIREMPDKKEPVNKAA